MCQAGGEWGCGPERSPEELVAISIYEFEALVLEDEADPLGKPSALLNGGSITKRPLWSMKPSCAFWYPVRTVWPVLLLHSYVKTALPAESIQAHVDSPIFTCARPFTNCVAAIYRPGITSAPTVLIKK